MIDNIAPGTCPFRQFGLMMLLVLAVALPRDVMAQDAAPPGGGNHEVVVAIKEAAPFVIKGADGAWHGISIDLWRHVAEGLRLRYRFAEQPTVQALIDAVATGSADAAISAITVTPARRQQVDFTQPFYSTGLGVAVQAGGVAGWLPLLRALLSFSFLQAVLALLGIALFVGVLVWLVERRENDAFGGKPVQGLTHGVWWSAVAMTQAGAAQNAPASVTGRVIAVVWMVASIIALATFTAGITSALTTHRLQGLVRNGDDLRVIRVGAVAVSSTIDYLDGRRIDHRDFASVEDALRSLMAGQIDAVVYDRPLLAWTVHQGFSGAELPTVSFDPQTYAVALPFNSDLRGPLDVALLEAVRSEWWRQTLFRYLGQDGAAGAS
jgi:polar amino acid transport system substrate-binding protein